MLDNHQRHKLHIMILQVGRPKIDVFKTESGKNLSISLDQSNMG
jgi:hypothetical protein